MKTLPLTDVIIPPNRQRKVFDAKALAELQQSIVDVGLLQPIVLRNDGRTLVCGERRLRAVAQLNGEYRHDGEAVAAASIPFVTVAELDAILLRQAELEENVCRNDLRWDERAKAIAELHALRKAASPGQTIRDTAEEISGSNPSGPAQAAVSNALLVAKFLDDPIVAAQPDIKTALKVIRDQQKQDERIRLSKEFDPAKSPHTLTNGSCYEATDSEVFDVVVTDPPYGIDAHLKDTFDTEQHEYDDSDAAFQQLITEGPPLFFRTMRPDAHAYIFCDIKRFTELRVAFELGGFTTWARPLIWDKGNTGSFGNIDYGFRACYDAILFAMKGKRKVTAGYRDVINITQQTNHVHPAGKPVELYVELLKRSALPGNRVADFFAGGGPIFLAAKQLKLIASGWENHPKYYPLASEALRKASE